VRYKHTAIVTRRGVEWHGRAKGGRLFVEPLAQVKAVKVAACTWALCACKKRLKGRAIDHDCFRLDSSPAGALRRRERLLLVVFKVTGMNTIVGAIFFNCNDCLVKAFS